MTVGGKDMPEEDQPNIEELFWMDADMAMDLMYARARAFTLAFEEHKGRGHHCAELGENAHALVLAAQKFADAFMRAIEATEPPTEESAV